MGQCAACGTQNPPGARFCHTCGAALEETETRRTVTVLFADVVDSTPLGERLDPEALRHVMGSWFGAAEAALAAHGGTVEKFIGDAVMAVFGIPQAHEDDALRAVRAAVELRDRLARLNDGLEERYGVRVALRIAVATGEVVAGAASARQALVTGDVVNTAKRLESAAGAGEILVGAVTRSLVAGAALLEPVEPVAAKGKAEPVPAWRLVELDPAAEGVPRRLDAPLVGRERELAALQEALDLAVVERRCVVATVVGPAGIGKSRLARELAERVAQRAAVLVGRCQPYGSGVTFWPVAEVVRALGGREGLDAALQGVSDGPLVVERVLAATGEGRASTPDEIFWGIRRLLERLAADRPVVLGLEDVHWAEPTLHDLVAYLAGWTRDAPVLVLQLARPELHEIRPPAHDALVVELGPLSGSEADRLLDELGLEDPAVRARVAAAAEGNPLFAEQLAAMLRETGETSGLPPSIGALLGARLDALPERERAALCRAAATGREFPLGGLRTLTPATESEGLGAALLSLVRKGLVEPWGDRPGEDVFRFRHALIRDAAYAALPKRDRADLHERYAGWLDEHAAAGDRDELVAYHLEQSYRARTELGPPDEQARELARRAGERAAAAGRRALAERGDVRAAAALLGTAAELLPAGDPVRDGVLVELGSARMRTGDFAGARTALAAAEESVDERTRLRARVEGGFLRSFTEPEGSTEEILRIALDTLPRLGELGDDRGLAKAWWLLSEVHVIGCRWTERANALEKALAHARKAGDAREEATFVAQLAHALRYGPTPVADAIPRCQEFLVGAGGDRSLEAAVASTLAGLQAMRGDFDAARKLWLRARTNFEELGLAYRRAARSLVAAEIEALADDLPAAERELRAGYDTLTAMGERGVRSTLAAYLARTLAEQGRDDEALELSRISEEAAASDDLVTQVVWREARALVLARRGELDEAAALAERALALAEATDFPELEAGALIALGGVRAASGSDAAELVERARELYERKGNVVAARRVAAGATVGAL